VKAGNWSLFSCRQIVQEHGGDIEVTSSPAGTTVKIVLPLEQQAPSSLMRRRTSAI
jgi:signal transduction histidine kinase